MGTGIDLNDSGADNAPAVDVSASSVEGDDIDNLFYDSNEQKINISESSKEGDAIEDLFNSSQVSVASQKKAAHVPVLAGEEKENEHPNPDQNLITPRKEKQEIQLQPTQPVRSLHSGRGSPINPAGSVAKRQLSMQSPQSPSVRAGVMNEEEKQSETASFPLRDITRQEQQSPSPRKKLSKRFSNIAAPLVNAGVRDLVTALDAALGAAIDDEDGSSKPLVLENPQPMQQSQLVVGDNSNHNDDNNSGDPDDAFLNQPVELDCIGGGDSRILADLLPAFPTTPFATPTKPNGESASPIRREVHSPVATLSFLSGDGLESGNGERTCDFIKPIEIFLETDSHDKSEAERAAVVADALSVADEMAGQLGSQDGIDLENKLAVVVVQEYEEAFEREKEQARQKQSEAAILAAQDKALALEEQKQTLTLQFETAQEEAIAEIARIAETEMKGAQRALQEREAVFKEEQARAAQRAELDKADALARAHAEAEQAKELALQGQRISLTSEFEAAKEAAVAGVRKEAEKAKTLAVEQAARSAQVAAKEAHDIDLKKQEEAFASRLSAATTVAAEHAAAEHQMQMRTIETASQEREAVFKAEQTRAAKQAELDKADALARAHAEAQQAKELALQEQRITLTSEFETARRTAVTEAAAYEAQPPALKAGITILESDLNGQEETDETESVLSVNEESKNPSLYLVNPDFKNLLYDIETLRWYLQWLNDTNRADMQKLHRTEVSRSNDMKLVDEKKNLTTNLALSLKSQIDGFNSEEKTVGKLITFEKKFLELIDEAYKDPRINRHRDCRPLLANIAIGVVTVGAVFALGYVAVAAQIALAVVAAVGLVAKAYHSYNVSGNAYPFFARTARQGYLDAIRDEVPRLPMLATPGN